MIRAKTCLLRAVAGMGSCSGMNGTASCLATSVCLSLLGTEIYKTVKGMSDLIKTKQDW